ncbi:MAG: rhomboid family intramembrane serine protease [Bacteroidota bacterium]
MYQWGILPREFSGLRGILIWPLLHGSWEHLFSNFFPLIVLTGMIGVFYPKAFWPVWLGSYLIPGIWLWAAGPSGTYTIGASGMVYALAFFLVFTGIFHRKPRQLIVSLLVIFLYGGMVWGLLPLDPHVSWQGHLFGAISGILLAYYFRKITQPDTGPTYAWENEPDQSPEDVIAPWNLDAWGPPPEGFNYSQQDHGTKKGTD